MGDTLVNRKCVDTTSGSLSKQTSFNKPKLSVQSKTQITKSASSSDSPPNSCVQESATSWPDMDDDDDDDGWSISKRLDKLCMDMYKRCNICGKLLNSYAAKWSINVCSHCNNFYLCFDCHDQGKYKDSHNYEFELRDVYNRFKLEF